MGCVAALASSQAGGRSPALPQRRSMCSRRVLGTAAQGCWEWEHSLSHEQDSQVTRQNCPTGLSRLGTKLGLPGGVGSWGAAPSLLEEDGRFLLVSAQPHL